MITQPTRQEIELLLLQSGLKKYPFDDCNIRYHDGKEERIWINGNIVQVSPDDLIWENFERDILHVLCGINATPKSD